MQAIANYSIWVYIVIVLLAAGFTYWTYWRNDQNVFSIPQRLVLTGLRFTEFLLLGLLLFSPLILVNRSRVIKPQIVIAIDQSSSVGKSLSTQARNQLYDQIQKGIELLDSRYEIDTLSFGDEVRSSMQGSFADKHTEMASLSSYISDHYYEKPLKEILLISDGYVNKGIEPFGPQYLLSAPITAVAIGDTVTIPDFAIGVLHTPQTVLRQNDIVANIEASCKNSKSRRATLQVTLDGKVVHTEQIDFEYQDDIVARQINIPATGIGVHNLCARISAAEKEYDLSNNVKCNRVEITDEKLQVALCYSAPHPDIAAISRALESQQNVQLTKHRGLPSSLAGKIIVAHNFGNNSDIQTVLQSNSPVWIISGLRSNTAGWTQSAALRPKNGGAGESMAKFNPNFSFFEKTFIDEGVVAALPPLVLGPNHPEFSSNAENLFTTSAGSALFSYRSGAVPMAITAGEGLWRWRIANHRTRQNSQMFDAMVQQTILFLKQSKKKNHFTVQTSKTSVPLGQEMVWTAQFYNQNMELDNSPSVDVVIQGGGIKRKLQMNKTKNDYLLVVDDFPPGKYSYTATLRGQGVSKSRSGNFEVQNIDIEAAIPYANMPLLSRITSQWGGQVIVPAQLKQWFEQADQKEYPDAIVKENSWKDAIDLAWIGLWIALLLIAEWLLRKWWGSI